MQISKASFTKKQLISQMKLCKHNVSDDYKKSPPIDILLSYGEIDSFLKSENKLERKNSLFKSFTSNDKSVDKQNMRYHDSSYDPFSRGLYHPTNSSKKSLSIESQKYNLLIYINRKIKS